MNNEIAPASGKADRRPALSFTILINNYNYARFLSKAIDSAFAQTWPNVQIIVVDDGSTDNSLEIAARYEGKNYRVLEKKNGGQASCIAHGLKHATRDYTIILDSDDSLLPFACEEIARAIGDKCPDAVFYGLEKIDKDGRGIGFFPTFPFVMNGQRQFILNSGFLPSSPTSGNAFRTAFMKECFEFVRPGTGSVDGFLSWAAGWREHVICLPDRLGRYLVHGANMSTSAGKDPVRRYRAANHLLSHCRHLAAFMVATSEWQGDWHELINAYGWREILLLKLRDRRFDEFAWRECRNYGVEKFYRASYIGVWKKVKNIFFLLVGSLVGELRDFIEGKRD